MFNFAPFKAYIGIHDVPFVGFKAIIRQDFIRRLSVFFYLFRLRAFAGINANQRAQIGQTKLAGLNIPFQFRPRFSGGVGQRAVNIAITNAAIEVAVIKDRGLFRVDFRNQMPVRFKRWRIR